MARKLQVRVALRQAAWEDVADGCELLPGLMVSGRRMGQAGKVWRPGEPGGDDRTPASCVGPGWLWECRGRHCSDRHLVAAVRNVHDVPAQCWEPGGARAGDGQDVRPQEPSSSCSWLPGSPAVLGVRCRHARRVHPRVSAARWATSLTCRCLGTGWQSSGVTCWRCRLPTPPSLGPKRLGRSDDLGRDSPGGGGSGLAA